MMSYLLNLWRRVRPTMPIGKNVVKIEEVKIQRVKGVKDTAESGYKRGKASDLVLTVVEI